MKVTAISGSPRKKGDCFNVIEMIQISILDSVKAAYCATQKESSTAPIKK
ncbi:NAD(P)H-dependent oxidoreductase [Lacrimispora amygdalina]|nr:NAD(P)H-dependent oxidoreductase [Lacrimispora amygdalina]